MKKHVILLLAIGLSMVVGCKPNLKFRSADIDFTAKTVAITEANVGNKAAGAHLTYIEINAVDASDSAKPQSQHSVNVPVIAKGGAWSSGPIPFAKFSSPRGLSLSSLTTANLVVRVDAKNMVLESNEADNVYDANR